MHHEHPQGEGNWPAPAREDDGSDVPDLALLPKAARYVDPEVGVGPRSFRSNDAEALAFGRFAEIMASEALEKLRLWTSSTSAVQCYRGSDGSSAPALDAPGEG